MIKELLHYKRNMENIIELDYSTTNTFIIEGDKGKILFDTGWAGTFEAFCSSLAFQKKSLQDIDYVMISHFHPDHMGLAQQIADCGPVVAVFDVQKNYIHSSDGIFEKERNRAFRPIDDDKVRLIELKNSRAWLSELGIDGEVIYTPGHSTDSVSLYLDGGVLFVGDLNPLYELELHAGTEIEKSWQKLLSLRPLTIYYGHAKAHQEIDRILR